MNNRFLLFFIALFISSLSIQKMNAQVKKTLQNGNLLTEVKKIQNRFSDSLSHYDYKKDSVVYTEKYKSFYGEKIRDLKNLYQNIYDKEVMIGKVDPSISFKTTTGMQIENNVPQTRILSKEEVNNATITIAQPRITPPEVVKSKSVDIAEVENYKQLDELKKRLTIDFPTYLIEDLGGEIYRCKLNFTIDVDGKFKKIKYTGSSNTEFGVISALFLYAIGGLEKPLFYDKKPIVQSFAQPITLRFE